MSTHRKSWDSFEAMRAAAEEGDAQAQCYLGVCFQNGQGVEQDYQEAVKWYRRSAEQNDPVAQCYLGVCYLNGAGVPQEFGEAAKWLREAAEQDDPAAQFNLGMLYETGQGVPQNYAEAVKWYRESAEHGYPAAQFNLGVFYETGQVVPQDFQEAVKWYLAAAEQECAPGAMQSRPVLPDRPRRGTKPVGGGEMVHPRRAAGRQNRPAQSRPALRRAGIGGNRRRGNREEHAALKFEMTNGNGPSSFFIRHFQFRQLRARPAGSMVAAANSQPSASDLALPATNNAAPALSKTASRFGPRSSPRKMRRMISAFTILSPPRKSASVAGCNGKFPATKPKRKAALLIKFRDVIGAERGKLVQEISAFRLPPSAFPAHHHAAPGAERLQRPRHRLAQFRARHADEHRGGPRGIQQRAENVENGPLAALGAKFSRRRDVFERRMKIRREEKREVVFAQRARRVRRRQIHPDAEFFDHVRAADRRGHGAVAVLGHGHAGGGAQNGDGGGNVERAQAVAAGADHVENFARPAFRRRSAAGRIFRAARRRTRRFPPASRLFAPAR